MPPRLVRRRPLSERIMGAINPWDFLLWLSEEIETRDLDSKAVGTQVGLLINFVFLLARANSRPIQDADDVFSNNSGSGWMSYIIQLITWCSTVGSVANAVYVFWRTRQYRLFEANVEQGPGTPSAHRVRVQNSPASSSPLRLLSDIIGAESAESRAHPDSTRDVWELGIWDPRPICLHALIFFSPLHALVYIFELPLDPLDPRPSVTVFKCVLLQVGLSMLLQLLQTKNEQRQKDTAIIQKEVFHEYDTKYVHPRLHPVVRDVATQVSMDDPEGEQESVESGTPTTLIRRGFQTRPNPNYLKHIDPDNLRASPVNLRASPVNNVMNPGLFTPATRSRHSDSSLISSHQMRTRQSMPASGTPGISKGSQVAPVPSVSTGTTGFGGSLGAFTHANSPLKKATSLSDINNEGGFFSPRNSRELAAIEQRDASERLQRRFSPVKEDRSQTTDRSRKSYGLERSPAPLGNPFVVKPKPNPARYERYPSRW